MPDYRLYRLNRYTGHIDGVEILHSSDDVGAICLAQEEPREVPTELWRGGRKLGRFEAHPDISAPARMPLR